MKKGTLGESDIQREDSMDWAIHLLKQKSHASSFRSVALLGVVLEYTGDLAAKKSQLQELLR